MLDDAERRRRRREAQARYKAKNPEKVKKAQLAYYYKHRQARIEQERDRTRRRQARRAEMLQSQQGLCYLCGCALAIEDAHIDHWHGCCPSTVNDYCPRCIRGLAHRSCNQALGQIGEDPDILRHMADAIEAANNRIQNGQVYLWR